MASITIRLAEAEDAEAMTLMHLQSWREAYGRLLPPEFFADAEARVPERVEQRRQRLLRGPGALVAVDDGGDIVGVAHAGPARDPDAPAERELYMIYTLGRVHGLGVGQALFDAAIGTEDAFLWVLEDNPRAIAFYRRNGFRQDGARKLLPESWSSLPEIRLVRKRS